MRCFTSLLVVTILLVNSVSADEIRPGVYRTPDSRFENLPGFDFEPKYKDINAEDRSRHCLEICCCN